MQIDEPVSVIVAGILRAGKITRLPGELPAGYSTGTGEFPYYGVTILSPRCELVQLYFLPDEIKPAPVL